MKRRSHSFLLVILALTLASFACQALGGTTPAATPAPQQTQAPSSPATETSSQPTLEPAIVDSQGVGILCVGSGTGLSCLSEKGWQVYTDKNSDLPNNYLYAGAVCPDGKIAIAHISGVVLFDGTTFKQLAEMPNSSSPEGIACEADGSIWVAHFQGVSRYSNGQWTTYGAEK